MKNYFVEVFLIAAFISVVMSCLLITVWQQEVVLFVEDLSQIAVNSQVQQ